MGLLLFVELLEGLFGLFNLILLFLGVSQQGDLISQSLLSGLILRLELLDLLLSNDESLLKLLDFISLLNKGLGIEISLRSDSLIE